MKKMICFALLTVLLLFVSCSALAVNASYKDGRITVSTESSGFFEIWVDGAGSGYWCGTGRPSSTFSYPLEDGEHSIRLFSPDGDAPETTTFTVGSAPVVTAEPQPQVTATPKPAGNDPAPEVTVAPTGETTAEPAPVVTAEPAVPVEKPEVTIPPVVEAAPAQSEVLVAPTCTDSGKTVGGDTIPALGHCYLVEGKSSNEIKYQCVRCGRTMRKQTNEKVENRLGNILKDVHGQPVNYQGYTLANTPGTYFIQSNGNGEVASLYLENQVIAQLFREGYQYISYINGNVNLTVGVNSITKKWFPDGLKISAYVLQTGDLGTDGMIAVINAETDDGFVPAVLFTGVTLNGAEITQNGVY